jgi:predicted RNA-binding protein with PUA-like domain
MINYWLLKSEPYVYSIHHLKNDGQTVWDGVRNYQARNFLRQMIKGDLCFFYHSNVNVPGIFGLVQVVENYVIDPTQFNPQSKYYDPKSTREKPRWHTVSVKFVKIFPNPVYLKQLKEEFNSDDLLLIRRGNRLSVMPIEPNIAQKIFQLGGIKEV